ncbi:MAG TPA: RecX family transcriptional regulator [Methylomirabilota bacterium]|jgi:regulatory protein|nr:RecX family transcriptional regulator [Methylomirabilota bacterium]
MGGGSDGSGSGRQASPGQGRAQASRRKARQAAPATGERLEAAAIRYLERYAASARHLERLLLNKVRRSAEAHGTDAEAGAAFVRALIARLQGSGILDDRRYAEGKAQSLRRKGGSARAIRAALAVKGVARETVETALVTADEESAGAEADLAAARRFAERRRLGPWRTKERAAHRLKDLAALGRAGFSYDVARRVMEGEAED